MGKLFNVTVVLVIIFLWTWPVYPVVPHLINYQGRLSDTGGTPLDGAYTITFYIYDAEFGGTLLWEEKHTGTLIQKGIFSIMLGSVTTLNIAFDKPYFLEIKVGNEIMTPRQRITSVGYAIRAETAEQAKNADSVGGFQVSSIPSANKILVADSEGKLNPSILKTYDSGWFEISKNSYYAKQHNLGTIKLIPIIYYTYDKYSPEEMTTVVSAFQDTGISNSGSMRSRGIVISGLSSTEIGIVVGCDGIIAPENKTSSRTMTRSYGYCRILLVALE